MGIEQSINEVWRRIQALEGAEFETKTGKPFTFTVVGNVLRPSRTRYNLSKANFARALELWPLDGPGQISPLVRGPAYVWGILYDQRVRMGDW